MNLMLHGDQKFFCSGSVFTLTAFKMLVASRAQEGMGFSFNYAEEAPGSMFECGESWQVQTK